MPTVGEQVIELVVWVGADAGEHGAIHGCSQAIRCIEDVEHDPSRTPPASSVPIHVPSISEGGAGSDFFA